MTGLQFPFPEPPEPGQTIEVARGIHWIRLPLPMALDHANCYAIDEGDSWTLIDTGMMTDAAQQIWQALLSGPLAGKPVRRVIGTHHHPDHIGFLGWFKAQGAELMMSRTAWLMTRMLLLDVQPVTTPEAMEFYKRAGMPADLLAERAAARPFNFCDMVAPLPVGFTRLSEGDKITMGGRDWTVRLGSGHAPDHLTFWCDEGIVIGGDQLLPGISANISVHPNEVNANPLADWLESCARLAPFANDQQLVLPGHKLPFTGLPFRLQQMVENHLFALERLEEHLRTPRHVVQCFIPLFRRELTGSAYGMGLSESWAHLNYLLHQGRIRRWLDENGIWLWQKCEGASA